MVRYARKRILRPGSVQTHWGRGLTASRILGERKIFWIYPSTTACNEVVNSSLQHIVLSAAAAKQKIRLFLYSVVY